MFDKKSDAKMEPESIRLAYEENARIHKYYQDWRHRILTRFALTVGFVIVAGTNVYEHVEIRTWAISTLFGLLGGSGIACMAMDARNWRMINAAERAGAELEVKMFGEDLAKKLFFYFENDANRGVKSLHTYNYMLATIYGFAAIVAFSSSIWVARGGLDRMSSENQESRIAEQVGTDQSATAPEPKDSQKPQPEGEGCFK